MQSSLLIFIDVNVNCIKVIRVALNKRAHMELMIDLD